MKAAVRHEYGPPEALNVEEVQTPTPADDEVLVRVHAASVNRGDWEILTGEPRYAPVLLQIFGPKPRHKVILVNNGGASRRRRGLFKPRYKILGTDVAGRVEAVGADVTQFRPGDEVFGDCAYFGGAFAEYVCVPEKAPLVAKPVSMTFEQAAAMPLAASIAVEGLRNKGQVQPGQRVLINGAGGGVGTFAVQIAKLYGAEVTGVDGPGKRDLLRSIGCDHVIDYTQEDFAQKGQRYDVILDIVANRPVLKCKSALTPSGIYLVVGGSWTALWQSVLLGPFISRTGKGRVALLLAGPTREILTHLTELFEAGKVVPVIDGCYPLAAAREALRRVGNNLSEGKVIITP